MPDRVPLWARPGRTPVDEPFTWLSLALRVFGLPAMALLWWALAFLPWKRADVVSLATSWPPTVPVWLTDLDVALFGPVGASLVVIALLGQRALAGLSILIGLVVPVVLTVASGADLTGDFVSTTERQIMLGAVTAAAVAGLGIGVVAIESLRRFGFLGLLAVSPVASLAGVLFLGPGEDHRWLTRLAVAVLLVMIAWRRWSGVLLWPVFLALLWVLNLTMSALGYGAQTLRRPGEGIASVGSVGEAMLDFAHSSWRVLMGTTWEVFWPAALLAGLSTAAVYLWRRTGDAQV